MQVWWQQFSEWWLINVQVKEDVDARTTAVYLAVAFLVGVGVAVMHRLFRGRDSNRPVGLGTTLILLCVIVALVTHVIGGNLARGFGLVGALSIVRFRTSVTDTRDTAFVIFSVAIGMAVGAGYMRSTAVALPSMALYCFLICLFGRAPNAPGQLKLKLASGTNAQALLAEFMGKSIARCELLRSGTNGKSGSVQLTYRVYLKPGSDAAGLVESLRSRPNVQKASWSFRVLRDP